MVKKSYRELFLFIYNLIYLNLKELFNYRNWENHSNTDCSELRSNYMKKLKSKRSTDRYEKFLHPPARKHPRQSAD
jgi:hypothetical protein